MIKIGVIADDFTGATDIASFLVENGLPTVQINGVPTGKMPEAIDALVISLKTRSCPVVEATQQSLAALSWLQQQGCKQIYFKYCSTFDSTAKGNIGPVTDALMDALDTPFTVFSPALSVNGRTVYQGYLFVMNQLLAESGMRHHPVNPMTDSYLPRLVEAQSTGRCGVVSAHVFEQGVDAVRQELARLQQEGYRYAVVRVWFIIARSIVWRIHQVAYVEKRKPRSGSNFSTARISPRLPSSIRSSNARPRLP